MDYHRFRLFAESWNVAYRKRKESIPFAKEKGKYTIIKNPFRYWAADPFLFEKDNNIYIFAELYDYKLAKGVIGYLQLNSNNPRWVPVIQESYHLSYPCVYEINSDIYILPEAHKSKTLYRYRAVDFPDKWVKEDVLLTNVSLVDTTPIREHKYDIAITYDLEDESLKLINLLDKSIKPLCHDEKGIKRPAGYISVETGIRIAQENVEDYGKGLIVYSFELTDNYSFSESVIKTVYPRDLSFNKKIYLDGIHTYNQSKHYEVIDIKTRRFNLLNFGMRLYRRFNKRR